MRQGSLDQGALQLLRFLDANPLTPIACAIAAKFGFLRSQPASRKPLAFISISTKPSVPLFSTMTLTGSPSLRERNEVAHHHAEAAIARHRDHLPTGVGRLRADGLQHRVGHRSVIERTDDPAPAVDLEIARRPDDRRTDVAGEDGVVRGEFADQARDILRMDDLLFGPLSASASRSRRAFL